MYKILLLTDFSVASRHAIAYTQTLFADTAADFCLLNAFPLEPEVGFTGAFLIVEEREQAEKSLIALRHEVTQQPEPAYHTYRTVVVPGSPEASVDVMLHQEHFDLVVVGATGSGRSELLGSVATAITRTATTNVLVVPATFPIRPLERIVLSTDYRSVNDAESFGILADIANRKGAQLTLLTIDKSGTAGATDLTRQYVEQAFDSVSTDSYVIHDNNVLHGINAYLDAHTVDLLVLLPHHKGFFDVLRNNSVTRSVAYHPRVPLLTLYDAEPKKTATAEMPELDNLPFATYL
ncbi:universal stress protein [Spirosoma fluviale]|uniref:Nucleotide-binding universal stress protein, UspA family n=1 Tax=Spirosoma fluviale TaxID=1597977 RepID=A0A286GD32_9BACT|nr:universal stress protein [Spirosoma fluviale]SOD93411.1 Nucleotide-binding universal stress protein, UspA family [Spirosoma fluviale]